MKKIISYIAKNKRFTIILAGIIVLNFSYGFDARFTIINLLWIFINIVKIDS